MSKFLSILIQKTFGYQQAKHTFVAMSKRNSFHKMPRFKPEVKVIKNRPEYSPSIFNRKEKVEVLSEPIKSVSDKKNYK